MHTLYIEDGNLLNCDIISVDSFVLHYGIIGKRVMYEQYI